ncbi:MAG: DUF3473 domain-containing protein [Thermogutta sp.]|nr:DUF3473 domain-containing protein [Thermogutta sp.]
MPPDVFSVDVEEYFQVSGFEKVLARSDWDAVPSRLAGCLSRILELLAIHGVQATFFILGWIAERRPRLVAEIAAAGHEIACHGYDHRLIYHMTPREFQEDVRRAKTVIEDAAGTAVVSYRAPSFSVTRDSLWALEVLADLGFRNDAGIFPIRHDRYGIPDAEPGPHRIVTPSGTIREFPGTTVRWAGCNVPLGGGGYLRLFPWWLTRRLMRRVRSRHGRPCMVYVHPWEIDPDQPEVKGASWLARRRHRVGLRTTEGKLRRMLAGFSFTRLDRCLDALPLPVVEWKRYSSRAPSRDSSRPPSRAKKGGAET